MSITYTSRDRQFFTVYVYPCRTPSLMTLMAFEDDIPN